MSPYSRACDKASTLGMQYHVTLFAMFVAAHRVPDGSCVEAPYVIPIVYCVPAQALQPVCCAAFADHDAVLFGAESVGEIVLHEPFSQACRIIEWLDEVVPVGDEFSFSPSL